MNSPTLDQLRSAVGRFSRYTAAEAAWTTLREATAPAIDPAAAGHRAALLAWLNAAGCRIRYPRPGEPDPFDSGVAHWWQRRGGELPAPGVALTELDDAGIEQVALCFAELSATPASLARRPRPLGPTAAAKLLYALRPQAVMPWDAAIAQALHGGRDGGAFAGHQRLGRAWGRAVLDEAGTDESSLAAQLGVTGRPLAKMLDDYCYLTLTVGWSAGASTPAG
ncbi:hypothetical protein ACIA8E_16875 [Streptomyces sp. NPDC051664]|uniref:hypothetical protein n=1 Tax=Streptomyces sp. NPDC051664 TaxID=3365668 RepID=UPI0037AF1B53